ncbi:hypothetical protein AN639_03930 [Candidatus Epulonipiscium fishelsonii]|uniref:Uncharacterized protein n=1 Tax=Candidatus Epulonipiscium fishelsonii TaxID=77094 RepID=A0ACC8XAL9_9FIRM|nr:hypothetical protein AN396_08450 [Epulopiscium sp. SCG-B11WGA-EpuloA1]ONI41210.1 hypothetical protein AN639_03930 [Epulopiscium sp. SCG-B05WGA-EpuloA1]
MSKKIKKFMMLITSVAMFTGCGGGSEEEVSSEVTYNYAQEAFGDIEPLAESVSLNVGSLSSSTHGFNNYLIEKLGGFDHANLDGEVIVFSSGPIMVEAMASGDCEAGPYGLGGTLAGTIGQDIVNIGAASRDYHALQFYAPNDSPIVAAGQVTPSAPELYGTPELWKGQEIFIPVGTTLHYMLSDGLQHLGLTTDDVKLTHMEVPNINTALRAGQCEIGGLWTNYPYGSINENNTAIMKADDVGTVLVTALATSQHVIDEKPEALQKWMELYFAAVDWTYASEENLAQAIEWFMEWNEENGIPSVEEEIAAHMEYQKCYTLEENLEMFNTLSENGEYNKFMEYNVEPLKFYIEQGNYKPEDMDKFMDPTYLNSTFLNNISGK